MSVYTKKYCMHACTCRHTKLTLCMFLPLLVSSRKKTASFVMEKAFTILWLVVGGKLFLGGVNTIILKESDKQAFPFLIKIPCCMSVINCFQFFCSTQAMSTCKIRHLLGNIEQVDYFLPFFLFLVKVRKHVKIRLWTDYYDLKLGKVIVIRFQIKIQ